jgi:ParB-like chromosome segregation protein Spo0J
MTASPNGRVMDDVAIVVPIDKIDPNPWNPNVQPDWIFQKEKKSITKFGFVDPLTVREVRFDRYQIIDGEHRWRAAKELGYTELPCWNLGLLDDADARELTVVLNETRGQPNEDRLRDLLNDLVARRGEESSVRDIMPFSRERFDELLQRRQIDWDALERRREALQEAGRWKELVYRVPYDAAKVIEDAIDGVRTREGFEHEWQALEMICADKTA